MNISNIKKEVNAMCGYDKLNFLCDLFIALGVNYEGGICESEPDFVEIFIAPQFTDKMKYDYLLKYTDFYNLKRNDYIYSFFNKDYKSGILQNNLDYDNVWQSHTKSTDLLLSELIGYGYIEHYNTLLEYSKGKEIEHKNIEGIFPFQTAEVCKFSKYDFSSNETNIKLFEYFTNNKKFLNSIDEYDYLCYYAEFAEPERIYCYLLHTMELPDIMNLILYSNPENDDEIRQQIKDFFEYNKYLIEIIELVNAYIKISGKNANPHITLSKLKKMFE